MKTLGRSRNELQDLSSRRRSNAFQTRSTSHTLYSLGYSVACRLAMGAVGAFASLVPVVGVALVWAPAAIGFAVTGSYGNAIALGLWGILVVGSIDNVLRPLVIGARDKQNPMLVGLAMLGGTYAIGPLGLLIGPLAISLTGGVIEELRKLNPSRMPGDLISEISPKATSIPEIMYSPTALQ